MQPHHLIIFQLGAVYKNFISISNMTKIILLVFAIYPMISSILYFEYDKSHWVDLRDKFVNLTDYNDVAIKSYEYGSVN